MPIEEISHAGWQRNLRLANEAVELIVTLEVGPRIISYRSLNGVNVLKNFPEHLGNSGETEWTIRGGHRHWIAPEDSVLTYAMDNEPFPFTILDHLCVKTTNSGIAPWFLKKETRIELAASGPGVTIEHTVINESGQTWQIAPWALTVMAPGGISILPQPPLGGHPRDLLPNRALVLWPYTDLTDPRLKMGRHFLILEQRAGSSPIKIGFAHQSGWAAYLLENQLFVKTVPWLADAVYPDFGCNYECFTNHEMLELETLGPLTSLAPGESVSHTEHWSLFSDLTPPPVEDSADFAEWLAPYLP